MRTKLLIALGILILLGLASVSALTIDSVSMSPDEIAPGETSEIRIGIENDGEKDVEDVSVSLMFRELIKDSFGNVISVNEVSFAPFDSSSEFSIDEIKDGKIDYAEFEIIALNDAESGIYKIPLEITYREDDEIKTKDSLISITVNSEPILGLGVEDGLFLKGKNNEITIKIVNKGLSDIEFLDIEIGSSTKYSLLSQKKIYIGDIDSDDFDTVKFKLFFKENIPSRISLPVSVSYKDALNNKYDEEFNLELRVYTEKQAIELGLIKRSKTGTYITVIVVLIVIWIIYRKIKKRRKMKKAESST